MDTPFFAMQNRHGDGCGEPPAFRNDAPSRYHGYFENALGEQWVFTYDRATHTGQLSGGDTGWDQPIPVTDGVAIGVLLRPDEIEWLRACWRAATEGR
jgi:hypothetical protein